MKALQQAAQNRSAREPGQPGPGDEPARSSVPGDGGEPAAPRSESEVAAGGVQAPAAVAADPAVPTGELALEPILDPVPWREAQAQPERPAAAQGTARFDAPDQRTSGSSRFPTGSSRFPTGGVPDPEVRPSSPVRAQAASQPDAGAPAAQDVRQDRRTPPRWSGDLQEGDARQAQIAGVRDVAAWRGAGGEAPSRRAAAVVLSVVADAVSRGR